MVLRFFLLALLFTATPSLACRMVPLEKNVDKYLFDLVKNTPDIYLAEAAAFSKDDGTVTLTVKEVLKGEKRESISVTSTLTNTKDTDYGRHYKTSFWEKILEGRTTYGTDCRFYPTFEIGKRYLVLFQEPFQAKSFELIRSKGDLWYFRVKEIIQLKKYRKMVFSKNSPS